MFDPSTSTKLWAGHVLIYIDNASRKHIDYIREQVVDMTSPPPVQTFTPSGMLENGAVNHLVDKLK